MAGYNRPGSYRRPSQRSRRRGAGPLVLLVGTVAVIAIVIIAAFMLRGHTGDDILNDPAANGEELVRVISEGLATPTPEPTAEPTPEPTPEPVPAADYGVRLPEPAGEGYLPIAARADTTEKIIAITVDDCFQFKNTRTIIDLVFDNGGNFTLFPIGKNVLREELYDTLHYAYEKGVEIENHTYEHQGHYRLNDEAMARQVYMQKAAVDYVLNIDYQEHFFRPMGGDGLDDQRLHIYCEQQGFRAIAYWSVSGSDSSIETLKKTLAPGHIYLFHTTDKDLAKLQEFIPYAVSQGYKLVTLNEMFALPVNEVKELDMPVTEREIPQIGEYTLSDRVYKNGDFAWMNYLVQQRLFDLGYIDAKPDGIFGDGTEAAVKAYQQAAGLTVTGEVDPDTLSRMFDGENPVLYQPINTNYPEPTTKPETEE